jgi:hypothetical protein
VSTVIGIDWGADGAACVIMKVDGKDIGVLESFKLGDREVATLKELDAPKDIILSEGATSLEIPITKMEVNEEWLRKMAGELDEPKKLNRAQRRKRKKNA